MREINNMMKKRFFFKLAGDWFCT